MNPRRAPRPRPPRDPVPDAASTSPRPDAADAVVDARLRVHGAPGLRVVDASVMPTIVSSNTNAPAIMIGERGAAFVRADAGD